MPLTHGKWFYRWHKLIPFTWDTLTNTNTFLIWEKENKAELCKLQFYSNYSRWHSKVFQFYEIHKNKAYCVYCQYCLIHLQMGRVAQLQDVIKTRLGLSAIHWLWWTETQTKNKYYFISYIKFLQFIIIKKEAKNQVYHCFSSIILYFYKKYNNKSFFFLSFFF